MKITKIWFDDEHLVGEDEDGNVYKQSEAVEGKVRNVEYVMK